jgi:hypothetical protein
MLIHELKAENRSGILSTQQKLNLRHTALWAVRSARRKHKCEMLEPNREVNKKSKTISLNPAIRFTGEFVHPNMIYFMNIHANMRRLSIGAALSEAGSQCSAQHWIISLESPLRAAVCKPKTLFETSHVAVAFSSSK